MPDHHRHDGFIWALIFSLIINLSFVFALLSQRAVEKSPHHQPFVVAITASQRALPGDSPATPRPKAIPAPTKRKKAAEPLTKAPAQSPDVDLTLPARSNAEGAAFSPAMASEMTETEIDLSPVATNGASATTAIDQETAAGRSIFKDKMAGEHYTAPEYLGGEKPPYPKRAERNGWEGTVLLSLSINANGAVEKVGIAKTSGYELLDHQARKSVCAWRFKPARRNGMAIAVTVQQPIVFRASPPEKVR